MSTFKRTLILILAALGAVSLWGIEGTLLCIQKHVSFWTKDIQLETAAAVVPNFIASLVAIVIASFMFYENARNRYIKAMRKVRGAIYELRKTSDADGQPVLDEHHAQRLMKVIVSAISALYFQKPMPDTTKEDENVTKVKCLLCPHPCPIDEGRCTECHDIPASWEPEERAVAK